MPYMHQRFGSKLAQVMACHRTDDKPSPEPMMTFSQFDYLEHISVKLNQNTKIFIGESAFENVVCKMIPSLFRLQHVM